MKKLLFLIVVPFALLVACNRSSPGDAPKAKPAAQQTPAAPPKAQDASSTTTTNIKAAAIGVAIKFTDQKTGKLLWTANVQRIEALSPESADQVYGTLHEVRGILYQNGAPADHITAPLVHIDNATKVVVATGGVVVTSITQLGTSLTCDQVTYHADTGHLIGQGNVVFRKAGFTQTSPSFAGDVKLKSVVMPAPGTGSGNGSVATQLKF